MMAILSRLTSKFNVISIKMPNFCFSLRGRLDDSKAYNDGDFPGAVVKNQPASAGDTGSSPGPGRFHIPWSN